MDHCIGNAEIFTTAEEALAIKRQARFGEAAAPDVPAAVGWMIVASFAAVMAAFLLLYTGSRTSTMMVTISIVYTIVYLTVPVIFLRIEPHRGRQIQMADFLEKGLDTWTGHVGGREAIVQFLTIPVCILVAILAIGIAAAIIL
jgi:hypothetical protein